MTGVSLVVKCGPYKKEDMLSRIEILESEIEELEEEQEDYEFGSCQYDYCDMELQAKYAELSRLKKK